jgi:hypothetical protein
MDKVTYIFGAGASALALPLAKGNPDLKIEGLPDALNRVKQDLENINVAEDLIKYKESLIEGLAWLSKKSEEFGTVDTFAKFCYLKSLKDFQKIKLILIFCFIYDQIIKQRFDHRYLVFLTTILQQSDTFPPEIKILNWNYDFQIQKAVNEFKEEGISIPDNSTIWQSIPLVNYYPPIGLHPVPNEINYASYSLVHLNGIAGYYHQNNSTIINPLYHSFKNTEDLIFGFKKYYDNPHSFNLLSFGFAAGYKERYLEKTVEIAKNIITDSKVLVVIGYSFPYFNREIDRQILDVLKTGGLKTIYYQDPNRNGDFLRNQFNLRSDINIRHVLRTDQFHIPDEL